MLPIETVAVLGTDERAGGCALLASLAGCAVRVHHPAPEALDRAFEALRFRVELAIERGLLTRTDRQRILDGILFTPDLEEAVTAADLVYGGVLDAGDDAPDWLERVAGLVRATSALALPDVAGAAAAAGNLPQPGRVLALRVDRLDGVTRVEALAAPATAAYVLLASAGFAARLNRRAEHG
jgi:hypothetical protein